MNYKNKISNDPSSPTPPKAPVNSSQTVQLPEPSSCKTEAAFGAAPLLDLHFARKKSSIIMSSKEWRKNQKLPDKVSIITIPFKVIDRINKGEIVKYNGISIRRSSEEALVGISNESPWNNQTRISSRDD